ncbi:hypothetical protein Hanom_Chr05g00423261 [Helianthus anomalus]
MEWKTLTNGIDFGVFTMRHMKTYKGGGAPWLTGFVKEDEVNNRRNSQLHLLRHIYISKIILPEYNLERQRIAKETNAFDKRPDKEKYIKDLDKKNPREVEGIYWKGQIDFFYVEFSCIVRLVRFH